MEFKVSVRHMVEFIYRCGDITSSSNGTLSKEAMNAGSKMHRKLQKMAGSYYDAEVPLKITMKKGRQLSKNSTAEKEKKYPLIL